MTAPKTIYSSPPTNIVIGAASCLFWDDPMNLQTVKNKPAKSDKLLYKFSCLHCISMCLTKVWLGETRRPKCCGMLHVVNWCSNWCSGGVYCLCLQGLEVQEEQPTVAKAKCLKIQSLPLFIQSVNDGPLTPGVPLVLFIDEIWSAGKHDNHILSKRYSSWSSRPWRWWQHNPKH